MSLGIIIGSDPQDVQNLSDTIELLKRTKESSDTFLGEERLDSIISWYTGIYTLLTDPSSFPYHEEDLSTTS